MFFEVQMSKLIPKRINECDIKSQKYDNWLKTLRIPNLLLVGGGSLLAFIGGAGIVAELFTTKFAGVMALIGGALTGFHGWMGCETHQQKCRTISSGYLSFKLKYEALLASTEDENVALKELDKQYAEFVSSIDVKPWF
jgi:hypothetical protein